MYPRNKNWSYNRLVKPHEAQKVVEIVNPEIVSIEASNDGKLLRPDGSNDKITFKNKKLKGKGKKVNFKENSESDYEEPEEPKKKPAQRLLETIKNEKREDIKPKNVKMNPKKQMSNEDKKKIQELMKRLRGGY
jgi:hypothetical protein